MLLQFLVDLLRVVHKPSLLILLKKDAVLNDEPLCSIQSIFSADGEEMLCTAIKENVMDDYLAQRGGYVDNHVRADSYRFLDDRSAGSLLILPIEKEEQIIGGLLAIHTRYDFFTENRMFFDTIMAQFIIALDNAGLYAKLFCHLIGKTGDCFDDKITEQVPVGIVDPLEMVDIEGVRSCISGQGCRNLLRDCGGDAQQCTQHEA